MLVDVVVVVLAERDGVLGAQDVLDEVDLDERDGRLELEVAVARLGDRVLRVEELGVEVVEAVLEVGVL